MDRGVLYRRCLYLSRLEGHDFVVDDSDLRTQDSFRPGARMLSRQLSSSPTLASEATSTNASSSLNESAVSFHENDFTFDSRASRIAIETDRVLVPSSVDVVPNSFNTPPISSAPEPEEPYYEDDDQPPSSNAPQPMSYHMAEAARLLRTLARYTSLEAQSYQMPNNFNRQKRHIMSAIKGGNLVLLIDQIWQFERELGMTEQNLRDLARPTYSILMSCWDRLEALIDGRVHELNTFADTAWEAAEFKDVPLIYRVAIVDSQGNSPTRRDALAAKEQLIEYHHFASTYNCSLMQPPRSALEVVVRKYLCKRGDNVFIGRQKRLDILKTFVLGLVHGHNPMCTIGFTTQPRQRQEQHEHHNSSNWLLALMQVALETKALTRGRFHQSFLPIFVMFEPGHGVAEIVFTRLLQCTINNGGFTHCPPGRSLESMKNVRSQDWCDLRDWAIEHTAIREEASRFPQQMAQMIQERIAEMNQYQLYFEEKGNYLVSLYGQRQ